MGKQKKDGVRISCLIRRDVKEKLDKYCQDVEESVTMAVENILDNYLTAYLEQKEKYQKKSKGDN